MADGVLKTLKASPRTPKAMLPESIAAVKAIAAFNRQRLRTEKERAEKLKLENAITRAEYIKRADLAKGLAMVADAIASRIQAADIPRHVKEEIQKDLATLPLILEEVGHAQSRFAAAKSKKSAATDADDEEATA